MTDDGKAVLELAMRLSPKERAEVAAKLVASVNEWAAADAAWAAVIEQRARRIAVDAFAGVPLRPRSPTTVRFELGAEVDLERAVSWYHATPGQARALLDEIEGALKLVRRAPTSFGRYTAARTAAEVRRVFLREFPYVLAFVHDGDVLHIVAVAHLYRAPDDGDISIDALIEVEQWLTVSGARAEGQSNPPMSSPLDTAL